MNFLNSSASKQIFLSIKFSVLDCKGDFALASRDVSQLIATITTNNWSVMNILQASKPYGKHCIRLFPPIFQIFRVFIM